MANRRYVWSAFAALVSVLLMPAAARAQSAIAGTVKDATGAVLPGVTVEASSDVLIERSKTVVTDAQGNYKIVDLRPGTYSMTFSREGCRAEEWEPEARHQRKVAAGVGPRRQ
jgi:Carboxypeptidase regulatory-like domain